MPCCSRGTSGRPAEARVSSATSGEISRSDGEEAYLGDDDEIGPPILDPDVVEGAGADGHPQVRCRIGEHLSHARAGLNGAQLLDGVDPIWVRKQCAGEQTSAGSDPEQVRQHTMLTIQCLVPEWRCVINVLNNIQRTGRLDRLADVR